MAAVFAGFKPGILMLGILILAVSCSHLQENGLSIGPDSGTQDPELSMGPDETSNAYSEILGEAAVSDDSFVHEEIPEPVPTAATEENPRLEQTGPSTSQQQGKGLLYLPAEAMNILLNISEHISKENFRIYVIVFADLAAKWQKRLEDGFKEMMEFMKQEENKLADAMNEGMPSKTEPNGESSRGVQQPGQQSPTSAITAVSRTGTYLTGKIWEAFNELREWLALAIGMVREEAANNELLRMVHEHPTEIVGNSLSLLASMQGPATTLSLPEWMHEVGSSTTSGLIRPSLYVISTLIFLNNQCAVCLASLADKMRQRLEAEKQNEQSEALSSETDQPEEAAQNAKECASISEEEAPAVASGSTVSGDELDEMESLIDSFNQCSKSLSECLYASGVSKLEYKEGDVKQQ